MRKTVSLSLLNERDNGLSVDFKLRPVLSFDVGINNFNGFDD
jgi:hypothetical protein